MDPELARKNVRLGPPLFGVACSSLAGSIVIADDLRRARLSAPSTPFRGRRSAGIRLAVKDLIDTAGLVTTYGSAIFRDHVPERTASAVAGFEEPGTGSSARRTCTSSPTGSRPTTPTSARS